MKNKEAKSDQNEALRALKMSLNGILVVITYFWLAILSVMLIKVVPMFIKIFTELGEPLPISTRILLGISNFLKTIWPLWILILIALFILIILVFARRDLQKRFLLPPLIAGIGIPSAIFLYGLIIGLILLALYAPMFRIITLIK